MTTTADATLRAALQHWKQHHVLALLDTHAALLQQLRHFEAWYPGGVDRYLRTATRLWRDQQSSPSTESAASADDREEDKESDPFASWVPTIPHDEYGLLTLEAPRFRELETVGLQHAAQSAFVVVAGGLGERLGYNGIKLALPVETVTRTSYLQLYIQHIQTLEHVTAATIPLAIMTSDATHNATQQFLETHEFFGMPPTQITLLKQDTVPCLDAVQVDGEETVLHLVLSKDDDPVLVMKPHGHGDVHTLLHSSGLARTWLHNQHKKYVHFIQDTNALILHSTLPLLGASIQNQWKWAFTVVPRKAKDASGAIVQFTHPEKDTTNRSALFNVEYHELDHFLRTKAGDAFCDGDTNDPATQFSPFPGNINHFVAELEAYVDVLDASRGLTPEIFNPKYRPDCPNLFKSPARLECMMQDFPKLLVAQNKKELDTTIGFLSFSASLVYSPCKNDTISAAAKVAADIPPQCASSAEHDGLALTKAKLQLIGVLSEDTAHGLADDGDITGAREDWLGIPVPPTARGPHIVFAPQFAVGLDALAQRFPTTSDISITNRSTLIVQGAGARGVTFFSLALDGALRITACEGAVVDVRGLEVANTGFEYATVELDTTSDPVDVMRGYVLNAREVMELTFHLPGRYVVEGNGKVTKA